MIYNYFLAFWLAIGLLMSHAPMAAASREELSERQGDFLITKDKVRVPKTWGRLVAVHHAGEYDFLYFEDDKGTVRQLHYSPSNGIPGAVYQIDRK